MASNTTSPRRNLQKFKDNKDSAKKIKNKEVYTHTEFLDYLEPFLEPLKEKHLTFLQTLSQPKSFKLKKDVYLRWIDQIKEKLCSIYVFNDEIEYEKIQFDTPLSLVQNIRKIQPDKTNFAEENEILENYRLKAFTSLVEEYKAQVERNNQRKKAIAAVIEERIRYFAYFRAFDLIKKELEDIQKKRVLSRKNRKSEFEMETISEYLNRISEFYDAFGMPDQFEDALNYPDLFTSNATPLEKSKEFQFFE